jgi:hypothetical protein
MNWVVNLTHRPPYSRESVRLGHLQRCSRRFWRSLAAIEIRTPDLPTCSLVTVPTKLLRFIWSYIFLRNIRKGQYNRQMKHDVPKSPKLSHSQLLRNNTIIAQHTQKYFSVILNWRFILSYGYYGWWVITEVTEIHKQTAKDYEINTQKKKNKNKKNKKNKNKNKKNKGRGERSEDIMLTTSPMMD